MVTPIRLRITSFPTVESQVRRRCSHLLAVCATLLCTFLCLGNPPQLRAQAGDTRNMCDDPSCRTDVLLLNSGYDGESESPYPPGSIDGLWSTSSEDGQWPGPAMVLEGTQEWRDMFPNSAWIGHDHHSANIVTFKRCFCVCETTTLTFMLKAVSTRNSTISMDGEVIVEMAPLNPKTAEFNRTVEPGVHCIEVTTYNDADGAALILQGTMQGPGLLKPECCIVPQNDGDECFTSNLTLATNSTWTIVSGQPPYTYPRCAAPVPNPYPGWANPPISGTSWISVNSDGQGVAAGHYIYRKCFCVRRDGVFAISITTLADNEVAVSLNGSPLFSQTGFQNPPAPVTRTFIVALTAGCNCLDFDVLNWGGPSGLDALVNIQGGALEKEGCCSCAACGSGGPPSGMLHGDSEDQSEHAGNSVSAVGNNTTGTVAARPTLVSIPNPATGETMVQYVIDKDAEARVELYNAAGQRVMVVDEGMRVRGPHAVPVTTKGLPAGAYRLQLKYGKETLSIPLNVQ